MKKPVIGLMIACAASAFAQSNGATTVVRILAPVNLVSPPGHLNACPAPPGTGLICRLYAKYVSTNAPLSRLCLGTGACVTAGGSLVVQYGEAAPNYLAIKTPRAMVNQTGTVEWRTEMVPVSP